MKYFASIFSLFIVSLLPAQEYFQQEVNYTINVKLNDEAHELSAFERLEYTNNSTSELGFIYFHLWPNAYKDQQTALAKQLLEEGNTDMYYAKPQDLGYIDSLDFKVNNVSAKLEYDPVNKDIAKLILNEPLRPGQKITITTPFHVKIPSGEISRLGHIGQAYTITQWYPKPAVYDLNGWNQMPYLNQGEFYSEFGSFDVSITLPKNYVLGATGDMEDGAAELAWLDQRIKDTEKKINELHSRKYLSDPDMAFPPSDKELKTLRFKQNNVHDFAWFCDKRYNVLKGEVTLPYSKRTVTTWAMFTDSEIELWQNAIAYLNDATFFYSLWNGDYQYKHVTAVDGTISAGGGMEYPNITVIGESSDDFALETVIMHEVGHNWFYGMLGSNERAHAWMDEGINSFNELRYIRTKYPGATVAAALGRDSTFTLFEANLYKHKAEYELLYKYSANLGIDQPCELQAKDYSELNYGAIVYSKTAIVFDYLMQYMGEDDFDRAMQFYFDQWKFRHPQPNDLRKTLEYFSEKDLSWFFDDLIGSTKKLDYKICSSKKLDDGNYEVMVKNSGEIKGPVALCGLKKGEIIGMVWYDGFDGKKLLTFPPSEIDEFRIDYFNYMPELNRKNNTLRRKGMLKKVEPLHLNLVGALDNPHKTQVFWSPVIGYNDYNNLMAGVAVYNHFLFQKKLEFDLMPMYAFGTKDLTGYSKLQFNFVTKEKSIQQVSLGARTARFAYLNDAGIGFPLSYLKIEPYATIDFRKKRARSTINQQLSYRFVIINKDSYTYSALDFTAGPVKTNDTRYFHDVTYHVENKRAVNPFDIKLNYQNGDGMSKAAVTATYSISISSKKSIELRFFGGAMFKRDPFAGDYRFRMSGQTGYQDYLYDNIYFGRSAYSAPQLGFQQFTETDGAFKIWSPLGQSDNWLASVNVKSPKIYKFPLQLYFDAGVFSTHVVTVSSGGTSQGITAPEFMYSGGIEIPLVKNIAEVYIPLVNSQNIIDAIQANNPNTRFIDMVRFKVNLRAANPINLIKESLPF